MPWPYAVFRAGTTQISFRAFACRAPNFAPNFAKFLAPNIYIYIKRHCQQGRSWPPPMGTRGLLQQPPKHRSDQTGSMDGDRGLLTYPAFAAAACRLQRHHNLHHERTTEHQCGDLCALPYLGPAPKFRENFAEFRILPHTQISKKNSQKIV